MSRPGWAWRPDDGDGDDQRAGAEDGAEGEPGRDAVREDVPGLLCRVLPMPNKTIGPKMPDRYPLAAVIRLSQAIAAVISTVPAMVTGLAPKRETRREAPAPGAGTARRPLRRHFLAPGQLAHLCGEG
jgi:hypothetical protein